MTPGIIPTGLRYPSFGLSASGLRNPCGCAVVGLSGAVRVSKSFGRSQLDRRTTKILVNSRTPVWGRWKEIHFFKDPLNDGLTLFRWHHLEHSLQTEQRLFLRFRDCQIGVKVITCFFIHLGGINGPLFPLAGGRARTGTAGRLWRDCSDCVGDGRGGGGGLKCPGCWTCTGTVGCHRPCLDCGGCAGGGPGRG